ncbi:hypothetical protein MY11210_009725 [Beauveria gryllotalpidicola]
MDNPALAQPDFAAAASGLRLAAEHLARCPNIPAMDAGAELMRRMDLMLEQIRSLNGKFDSLSGKFDSLNGKFDSLNGKFDSLNGKFDSLEEKFDSLEENVDSLEQTVIVSNRNLTTRLENSIVVSGEMALAPLYDLQTGEEIAECPRTLAELEALTAQQVGELLRSIGEAVPRGHDDRKRKLKQAFGVRTQVI